MSGLATAVATLVIIFIGTIVFGLTSFGGDIIFQVGWQCCYLISRNTCNGKLVAALGIITIVEFIKYPIQIYNLRAHLNWNFAARLGGAQMIGTALGLNILHAYGDSGILKCVFGVLLLFVVFWQIYHENDKPGSAASSSSSSAPSSSKISMLSVHKYSVLSDSSLTAMSEASNDSHNSHGHGSIEMRALTAAKVSDINPLSLSAQLSTISPGSASLALKSAATDFSFANYFGLGLVFNNNSSNSSSGGGSAKSTGLSVQNNTQGYSTKLSPGAAIVTKVGEATIAVSSTTHRSSAASRNFPHSSYICAVGGGAGGGETNTRMSSNNSMDSCDLRERERGEGCSSSGLDFEDPDDLDLDPHDKIPPPLRVTNWRLAVAIPFAGFIGGILGGMYGTSGPPLMILASSITIDKNEWMGSVCIAYLAENTTRFIFLIYWNEMFQSQGGEEYLYWVYGIGGFVCSLFGLWLGNAMGKHVNLVLWRRMLLGLLLIGSALMVVSGVRS